MIFDLHNDFPTVLRPQEFNSYFGRCDASIVGAIWTTELQIDSIDCIRKNLANFNGENRVFVAIEDLGFAAQKGLQSFDFSDILYCSLTWNFDNAFAGGAHGDGRLTPDGRRAIKRMNNSGCYTDVAHLNRKSFWDVIDVAEKIVCSHTGFTDNPRCLDEAQIKALVDRGVVIGLCTVSTFSGAHSADEFADVILRFVDEHGDGCLAIGTDFFGSEDIPSDIDGYGKLDVVWDMLARRGLPTQSVEKIFYLNAQSLIFGDR